MAKDVKATLFVTETDSCNENTIIDLRIQIGKEGALNSKNLKRLMNALIDLGVVDDVKATEPYRDGMKGRRR